MSHLLAALDDDVLAIAIGARALPGDQVPAGHIALDLIRRIAKPVELAWAGNLSRGRAAVVERLLAHATTPLVLVPVVGAATPDRPTSGEEVTRNARAG